MELARSSGIKKFCQPNMLLTFEEYLLDYNPKLSRKVKSFMSSEINKTTDTKVRQETVDYMKSPI